MDTIGDYLREARERRGLSLQALGRKLGVSKQYVSCIETGKVRPTAALCVRFARQLGLEVDVVLVKCGFVPPDVLALLQQHPEDGLEVVRRELLKLI